MLQLIKDSNGADTGVFVPIKDWMMLTQRHSDLIQLLEIKPAIARKNLSDLAGTLSNETADAMLKYVAESRSEWEERLQKQFK